MARRQPRARVWRSLPAGQRRSPGGGNDDALYWFDDAGNEDVGDGELSRQGDRLALVRSYGHNTHLAIYHFGGGAGGPAPEAACFTGNDATLAGPSWSPDGTKLAFQDEEGIAVLPLPQVVAGDCPGASSSTVVFPRASAPDWGPAAIGSGAGTYVAPGASEAPPSNTAPGANGTPTPLRLSRASVKLLRRAHASRVMVTVTLIPATGTRTVSTATVHLTRR